MQSDTVQFILGGACGSAPKENRKDTVTMNLSDFGFQEVGKCTLDNSLKSGVRFHVDDMRKDRVIYTYIMDGGVKYIGICGCM